MAMFLLRLMTDVIDLNRRLLFVYSCRSLTSRVITTLFSFYTNATFSILFKNLSENLYLTEIKSLHIRFHFVFRLNILQFYIHYYKLI